MITGNAAIRAAIVGPLGRTARLLRQRWEDRGRDKLHALEVECISKGKAWYEFGVKVSIATPSEPKATVLGEVAKSVCGFR